MVGRFFQALDLFGLYIKELPNLQILRVEITFTLPKAWAQQQADYRDPCKRNSHLYSLWRSSIQRDGHG